MSTIPVKMLCAHAVFFFYLNTVKVLELMGEMAAVSSKQLTLKPPKKQPEPPSQPVGFCVLSLFILALIKMRCGGFPSPGLGGYCGEEIGGCGGPPWAAHTNLPHPLSPLAAHPMWVLSS